MRSLHLVVPAALALTACGGAASGPAGTPAPTPTPDHAAAFAPPGACVDPVADAATRLDGVSPWGDPPDEAALDVDGDGTADKVFTAGAAYTEAGLVYVTRGACGHFVGDVQGAPSPGDARHHGLIELRVDEVSACEGAPCGCEQGVLLFRFDGTAYVLDEAASTHSAENDCPDAP